MRPGRGREAKSGHLARALDLAEECLHTGDPPFGAVVVSGSGLVAVGRNVSVSSGNPLRHAEMEALSAYFVKTRGSGEEEPLAVYCSTEPCLMCLGALHWSRISRVVYGGSQAALARVRGYGCRLGRRERNAMFPRIDFVGPLASVRAAAAWNTYFRRA